VSLLSVFVGARAFCGSVSIQYWPKFSQSMHSPPHPALRRPPGKLDKPKKEVPPRNEHSLHMHDLGA